MVRIVLIGLGLIISSVITYDLVQTPTPPFELSSLSDIDGDLPQEGRSEFDKLFGHFEGDNFVYTLPDHFEGLVQKLQENGSPVGVLVPIGRSLQRPFRIQLMDSFDSLFKRFWSEASGLARRSDIDFLKKHGLLFNPFKFPRVLVAQTAVEGHPSKIGPIFLGYLEPFNQIEVISFNKKMGRMEFQIVSDFKKGRTPKVHYVARKKCTQCHVAGNPLFPSIFWQETNTTKYMQKLVFKSIHGNFPTLETKKKKYMGVPILSQGLPPAPLFEKMVKTASQQLVLSLIWPHLCETKSLRCKKDLLKRALRNQPIETNIANFQADKQNAVKNLINPIFRDRQALGNLLEKAVKKFDPKRPAFGPMMDALEKIEFFGPPSTPEIEAKIAQELEERVLENLGSLVERARVFDDVHTPKNQGHAVGVIPLGQIIRQNLPRLKPLSEKTDLQASLLRAIDRLPGPLLAKPYFDAQALQSHILAQVDPDSIEIENDTHPPLPNHLLHRTVSLSGPLAPFEKRCSGCHTGPSWFPPPFLAGKTQHDVHRKILSLSEKILNYTVLPQPAMPPHYNDEINKDLVVIRHFLKQKSTHISCDPTHPISEEDILQTQRPPNAQALSLFSHYCKECHGPSSVYPESLPLDDLKALSANPQIYKNIQSGLMPPCDEKPLHGWPHRSERLLMLRWLQRQ